MKEEVRVPRSLLCDIFSTAVEFPVIGTSGNIEGWEREVTQIQHIVHFTDRLRKHYNWTRAVSRYVEPVNEELPLSYPQPRQTDIVIAGFVYETEKPGFDRACAIMDLAERLRPKII